MTAHISFRTIRGHVGQVLAGLALMGLTACATTNVPEPKYPVYMQDKPVETQPVAAAEPAPVEDAPRVAVSSAPGSVTSTPIAPLAPPPPPPPPEDMASPTAVVTAPVTDSRAAYVYTMVAQDTLYGISRRFGVPVKTLFEINGFDAAATFRVGQKVLLPQSAKDKGAEARANGPTLTPLSAALATTPAAQAEPAPKPKAVASLPAPSLPAPSLPAPVKPAAKPTVTTPAPVAAAKPVAAAPKTVPAAKPAPTIPAAAAPATKPAAAKPVTVTPPQPVAGFPTNAKLSQMGKGMFVWPVKGKTLTPFGQLAPNVRNDGINIAAASGTDVVAAADGIVVYQGDQVRELGNTVYIKHANGWYTGYSHLSSMKVSNNQKVTKGQVIGSVGATGTIDQPQLHFEIRYTPSTDIARPIDPKLVLP